MKRTSRESIDQIFVLLVLRDFGVESLINLEAWNIKRDYLSDKAQRAIEFVEDYYKRHDEQPGYELVITDVGWSKLTFNELPDMVPDKAASVILNRVKQNHVNRLRKALRDAKDSDAAIDKIVEFAEEGRKIGRSSQGKVIESFELYPEVLDRYEYEEEHDTSGWDTPWDTITNTVGGYKEGHVHYFCGRPGTGKTWCLILNTLCLWEQGCDVLFVSPEMSSDEIVTRQACVHAKVSYEDFENNELKSFDKKDLEEHVEKYKDAEGIKIIEGEMSFDPIEVEQAIWQFDPDVIVVDSFYKFEFDDDDTWGFNERDKIRRASEWLWEIARTIKRDRVVIAAAQLNRASESSPRGMTLDNLYGSDKIGQNAQTIYGLFQDPDMELNRQMGFEQMKCRSGPYHPHFFAHWCLDTMEFREINEDNKDADKDDGSDYDKYI